MNSSSSPEVGNLDPVIIQLIIALLQEAPTLYATVKGDVDAVVGGQMTAAQFNQKWSDMNVMWTAAKAKWSAG